VDLHLQISKAAKGHRAGDPLLISSAAEEMRRLTREDDQFWEARASLVATLTLLSKYPGNLSSRAAQEAEGQWAELCKPAVPPAPKDLARQMASKLTVGAVLEEIYASQLDRNCEDFDSGAFIPCDDAGIPGLGGSSSPCTLFTEREVATRLWPDELIEGLQIFRRGG
jgi:hypothetical protein